MILNAIFAVLALLSLGLLLWQWVAARRFPLHQRIADKSFTPAVTLLKSLKGADVSTEDCLRSWFAQQYAGEVQILFGVASADDPVCSVVRKLMQEFPKRDAQLVVCPELIGANAKVSKLAELEKLAKHEILVISDADVRVPADFLVNAVAPFHENDTQTHAASAPSPPRSGGEGRGEVALRAHGEYTNNPTIQQSIHPSAPPVGLVNCFYRLANPSTLAMQWEAIAINADFWSQVLQSQMLKPLDFALGAVMLTKRKYLDEIGGFKSLVDCLADDYQLGNRIARSGHRIVLCPVVVECWDPPMTWRAVWKHQLRWARTIRVCQPVPYFFSILSNAGFWALLALAVGLAQAQVQWSSPTYSATSTVIVGVMHYPIVTGIGAVALLVRIVVAQSLQSQLTRSSSHLAYFWLVPIKDLLQAAIWLFAFAGNRIEWRGQVFKLRRDGTLVKTPRENQDARG